MPHTKSSRGSQTAAAETKDQYHILVATSGDDSSDGAVRVALAIAKAKRASVEVLTVATPFSQSAPLPFHVAPPPAIDATARREAIAAVREQLARNGVHDEWPIRATVGWTIDRIAETAARWPASLIVVGHGEHGVLHRLLNAETAVKLAHHVAVPILIVPEHAANAPSHALVAIDFTPASMDAAMFAGELVGKTGALTLAYASMLISDAPAPGSLLDLQTTGAVQKLDSLRDNLHRAIGCPIEAVALSGEIVPSLTNYADHHECDTIALGGHEQSLIDRVVIGSIRSDLLRHAHQAVLVVPPRDAPREE